VRWPIFHRESRWVLIAPIIHIVVCLAALGYMVPGLESLGILFTFLLIVDFPVSFVYVVLAWGNGGIAFTWLIVVGTLWWYALCRAADRRITAYRAAHRAKSNS
jgi:hypothetical protein